jgi:hypothetical protein
MAKRVARVAVVLVALAIVLLSGVTIVLVVDLQCAGLRQAARLPERELAGAPVDEPVRARPLPPPLPGLVADLTVDATGKAGAKPSTPPPERVAAPPPPERGAVRGVVRFAGAPPKRERLKMSTEPFCARHAIDDEQVMVGHDGALANVIVRVIGAPPSLPPPERARVVQDKCQYRPRVQVVVAEQELEIVNGDPALHNAHLYRGNTTFSNRAQVPGTPPIDTKVPAGLLKLRCDVHPWMTGYVFAHENAFAVVTGDDGKFSIAGLVPGRVTLEAWHERFGSKRIEVTVTSGAWASTSFEFVASDH